jgi:protein phosphatase
VDTLSLSLLVAVPSLLLAGVAVRYLRGRGAVPGVAPVTGSAASIGGARATRTKTPALAADEMTLITFKPMVLDTPAPMPRVVAPSRTPEPAPPRPASQLVQVIVRDPRAQDGEPSVESPIILLSTVAQTHRGRRRKANEDSFVVLEDHQLFVVADGMGGYAGGEIASHLAVETIACMFEEGDFGPLDEELPQDGAQLAAAIQRANRAIWEHSLSDATLKGMGTTVVAVRFSPMKERVYIGHVGDSRCYRFREGNLEMLTSDHNLAALGVGGAHANALTRAVGVGPTVKIDIILVEPLPGDAFLLCSDGLTKMVPESTIRDVLAAAISAEVAVQALINQANANGGRDNITAVVVQLQDLPVEVPAGLSP